MVTKKASDAFPSVQGQIQDFKEGERCANLLFGNRFAESCMKMKEVGPRVGTAATVSPSLDLPMLLVNILLQKVLIY